MPENVKAAFVFLSWPDRAFFELNQNFALGKEPMCIVFPLVEYYIVIFEKACST